MKTNETKATETKFKGFEAKLVTGETVWVVNYSENLTCKRTGQKVAGYKIRERIVSGYRGWSGGCNPNYVWLAPRWIRADKLLK